ncbi:uncharacterized protein SPPG_06000 [Spizellomyces punctatus DAOM BR117]|uniref:Odorant receptor n=1 Tax=Spizellomyces punctatus (strain DAOM BR117) TaxID=645134 RepID=A0A0L0HDK0_SPIPD|nr:uncharacterized protein SPPG_06000 [Spizellomyces punctatus DAOM BR117]KNC99049.1 hypothetical protein SPPG_06000 [Spizellomyces punctatus DAOM BR117]|eukprot:XP_016607089.1 hypothetical protein SPPG_06000 [Spizellomyces punctatus DAOM BR117]
MTLLIVKTVECDPETSYASPETLSLGRTHIKGRKTWSMLDLESIDYQAVSLSTFKGARFLAFLFGVDPCLECRPMMRKIAKVVNVVCLCLVVVVLGAYIRMLMTVQGMMGLGQLALVLYILTTSIFLLVLHFLTRGQKPNDLSTLAARSGLLAPVRRHEETLVFAIFLGAFLGTTISWYVPVGIQLDDENAALWPMIWIWSPSDIYKYIHHGGVRFLYTFLHIVGVTVYDGATYAFLFRVYIMCKGLCYQWQTLRRDVPLTTPQDVEEFMTYFRKADTQLRKFCAANALAIAIFGIVHAINLGDGILLVFTSSNWNLPSFLVPTMILHAFATSLFSLVIVVYSLASVTDEVRRTIILLSDCLCRFRDTPSEMDTAARVHRFLCHLDRSPKGFQLYGFVVEMKLLLQGITAAIYAGSMWGFKRVIS